MTEPSGISLNSKNSLTDLSFALIESEDNGMGKYYLWTNEEMQFSLTYDRGHYECDISSPKKPINPMGLIRLLRFLRNDSTFYKKELIEANLWYTLTIDAYVKLFYNNYDLIKGFLTSFDQMKYDNYNEFEFSFDGI